MASHYLRYPNEVQQIHNHNGIIIQIIKTNNEFPNDGRSPLHESENQTLLTDFTIDNSGTLQELYKKIDVIYSFLNK
jgi:dephospho-CoA kinase